jgi:hypothetical protein
MKHTIRSYGLHSKTRHLRQICTSCEIQDVNVVERYMTIEPSEKKETAVG